MWILYLLTSKSVYIYFASLRCIVNWRFASVLSKKKTGHCIMKIIFPFLFYAHYLQTYGFAWKPGDRRIYVLPQKRQGARENVFIRCLTSPRGSLGVSRVYITANYHFWSRTSNLHASEFVSPVFNVGSPAPRYSVASVPYPSLAQGSPLWAPLSTHFI